ncbi:MAG TPA: 3-isopropylmalate dehydratase small subunit [Candidatus Angelobacter sp.]|nr:3-isopropylmalate dehydratase small subunit [Candidatus Angelobacter sp.]
MQSFSTHTGLVAPLDRVNVDTDQMVPKQFCKLLTRTGYGRVLFYDWRYKRGEKPNPEFVLNRPEYQGASILLTRANFGCGSSREHAPWALMDYGFRAILAPSFADIFYNNCFKNGLLPVILPEPVIDKLFQRVESIPSYRLHIDLAKHLISDVSGHVYYFMIDSFRKKCLLNGLDEIGLTLEYGDRIAAFEEAMSPQALLYSELK